MLKHPIDSFFILFFADDSRHEFRKLQTKYVNLQQERQQLLEKIASLETRKSQQSFEMLCAQVATDNTVYVV